MFSGLFHFFLGVQSELGRQTERGVRVKGGKSGSATWASAAELICFVYKPHLTPFIARSQAEARSEAARPKFSSPPSPNPPTVSVSVSSLIVFIGRSLRNSPLRPRLQRPTRPLPDRARSVGNGQKISLDDATEDLNIQCRRGRGSRLTLSLRNLITSSRNLFMCTHMLERSSRSRQNL